MAKKSFKTDLATEAFISKPQEPDLNEPKKPKQAGRKIKATVLHKTDGASWSQSGLTKDYTRASFIISVKNKQDVCNSILYAYTMGYEGAERSPQQIQEEGEVIPWQRKNLILTTRY